MATKSDIPSLQGRTMFVYQDDDTKDEAAFIIKNDPKTNLAEIQDWVKKGYIVRTRSDASVKVAKIRGLFRHGSRF